MGLSEFCENLFYYTVDGPVTVARDFIERQRAKGGSHVYYHKEYRRVTPIEDCRMDDQVCMYEAEIQYRRDKLVESEIIKILKDRIGQCAVEEGPNAKVNCREILEEYDKYADAFEKKYGELGANSSALSCMMKQKYRVYYERKGIHNKYNYPKTTEVAVE